MPEGRSLGGSRGMPPPPPLPTQIVFLDYSGAIVAAVLANSIVKEIALGHSLIPVSTLLLCRQKRKRAWDFCIGTPPFLIQKVSICHTLHNIHIYTAVCFLALDISSTLERCVGSLWCVFTKDPPVLTVFKFV